MKPIGPYVAVRDLPAGPEDGPIRTLRATDRLTGMPVLLHVLPFAPRLPELPDHPGLLPIVDGGMDGKDAYVVTELPMQATPASDPLLAAQGALAALAALHGQGQTHGGISSAQLWEVDGRVALAGAGLPWQDHPTPGRDLRDLILALEGIGILPPALTPLRRAPDELEAGEALALLNTPEGQVDAGRAVPAIPPPATTLPNREAAAPEPTSPPQPSVVVPNTAPPAPLAQPPERATATPIQNHPHDGTPIVLGGEIADDGPVATEENPPPTVIPSTPPVTPKSRKSRGVLNRGDGGREALSPPAAAPVISPPPGTDRLLDAEDASPSPPPSSENPPHMPATPTEAAIPEPVDPSPRPTTRDVSEPAPLTNTEPRPAAPLPELATPDAVMAATAGTPVPAFSSAPAGTVETPQERRRRQNEERLAQARLDAQAAAARKVERLRAEALARPPTTVQIGFTGPAASAGAVIGEDDLPDWTPPADAPAEDGSNPPARPKLTMRTVERLPESLRRAPEPEPEPEPRPSGLLPARHMAGGPIRIGWDEDDSWRVVKTVDGPPVREPRRAPRWLLPLIGLLALLALVAVVVPRLPRPGTPATTCCDVAFTLRGAAGATARLTLDTAPKGANLTPGQELGRAPGKLHLPVPGTYRLRVIAEGYAPGQLSVTVPRSQPVSINLGP
ncbi:PEGA domain-containing protein [Deinococcus sp. KSM4-11]|uniref:PEGA domain-containing protein n=1 Tax=Deinococcus sp. KSM4-11 TaxID=2568654 RepID=UPI0010A420F2|nr:PEGA domain-containing protein [Deinococcus sp. KSM4-11]THF88928.1 PEGA domain-containing protein [Deinococcus sp. KSM4-11]